jgi:predicted regulator of Ras-like GTPase activity (Roadblock/LC7/MglB family)
VTEQQPTADSVDMTWVLNRLKDEKGVLGALLLSSEGLVLAVSEGLDRAVAERTAATASGTFSLGRSIGEFADAEDVTPKRIIIDLPNACVLVFSAGYNTALAVSVGAEMTSGEVAVASAATVKAINGLRTVLSARERTAYRPS